MSIYMFPGKVQEINRRKKPPATTASSTTDHNFDTYRYAVEAPSFEKKREYHAIIKVTDNWKSSIKLPKYLNSFATNLRNKYLTNAELTGSHLLFKANRYGTELIVLYRKPDAVPENDSFTLLESILIPLPTSFLPACEQPDSKSNYISESEFSGCIPSQIRY